MIAQKSIKPQKESVMYLLFSKQNRRVLEEPIDGEVIEVIINRTKETLYENKKITRGKEMALTPFG